MITGVRSPRKGRRDGRHLRHQVAPSHLPFLRGGRAPTLRTQLGPLRVLRGPPQRDAPGDAPEDNQTARRCRRPRLRVRASGDAPPARRRVPVPGLRLGGTTRLATLRVYDQVVAALSSPRIIEPVRHVRFEVQSVTLLQQMLFAPEDGPQSPLLHDGVLLHAPAVRRELAGGRTIRNNVPDELDLT